MLVGHQLRDKEERPEERCKGIQSDLGRGFVFGDKQRLQS